MSDPESKIGYLDGLRGLAALSVVLSHFFCAFYPALIFGALATPHIGNIEDAIASSPLSVLFNGGFAVCIFFVLSGYVLTYKYFTTRKQEILTSSAVRRLIRLMVPVLFVVLLVYLMTRANLFYNSALNDIAGPTAWLASNIPTFNGSTLDLVKHAIWGIFFGSETFHYSVLWTMGIEFIGSLIVFSLVSLFGGVRNRWVVYLIAILYFINTYYCAFILGAMLADLKNLGFESKTLKNLGALVVTLIVALFFGSYYLAGWWGSGVYAMLCLSIVDPSMHFRIAGATLLLYAVISSPILQKWLSTALLQFVGKISFSMYLLHLAVILSLSAWLFISLYGIVPYNVAGVIVLCVTMPLLFVLSYLLYRYVDDPGTRLSRRIYRRFFNPKSPGILERDQMSEKEHSFH